MTIAHMQPSYTEQVTGAPKHTWNETEIKVQTLTGSTYTQVHNPGMANISVPPQAKRDCKTK